MFPFLHPSIFTTWLNVAMTLLITVVLNAILRSLIKIPKKLDSKRGRTYVSIVRSAISVLLFGIALHIIFIILNINIAPLLASAGIIGLAIGIGARSIIEDLIAGFFLLTHANLAIGDYISVGNGIEGIITDIGFRTITIRSASGALNIIPNGQVKLVTNYSHGQAVVEIDIPVKGEQNIDAIIEILQTVLTSLDKDTKDNYHIHPESKVVGIQDIKAGNCVLLRVRIITAPHERETIDKEYRYRVVKRFAEKKILLA